MGFGYWVYEINGDFLTAEDILFFAVKGNSDGLFDNTTCLFENLIFWLIIS
jgi:hypothetical protein